MHELNLNLEDRQELMWMGIFLGMGNSSQYDDEGMKKHIGSILEKADLRKESFLVEVLREKDISNKMALEDGSYAYVLESTETGWKPVKTYKKIRKNKEDISYSLCEKY